MKTATPVELIHFVIKQKLTNKQTKNEDSCTGSPRDSAAERAVELDGEEALLLLHHDGLGS